jgi:hypothetical protein
MHVQGVDLCWSEEPHLGGLIAGFHLTAHDAASKADRELLTDLTVVIGKDMPRV